MAESEAGSKKTRTPGARMSRAKLGGVTIQLEPAALVKLGLPLDYMACKCQLCGVLSSAESPFTVVIKGAVAKFAPLWPWANGTKDKPKGFVCLNLE